MSNAQELIALRRAQEEAAAGKTKTPKKLWGLKQVTKLLALTGAPSEAELHPHSLLHCTSSWKDGIILQNSFLACCLETVVDKTTAPTVMHAFARNIGTLAIATVSFETYDQWWQSSNCMV